MEEALEELQINKGDFPSITLIFHEKGAREHVAQRLKQQLEECFEIECNIKPYSWPNTFSKVTQGDFEISLMHWTSPG